MCGKAPIRTARGAEADGVGLEDHEPRVLEGSNAISGECFTKVVFVSPALLRSWLPPPASIPIHADDDSHTAPAKSLACRHRNQIQGTSAVWPAVRARFLELAC